MVPKKQIFMLMFYCLINSMLYAPSDYFETTKQKSPSDNAFGKKLISVLTRKPISDDPGFTTFTEPKKFFNKEWDLVDPSIDPVTRRIDPINAKRIEMQKYFDALTKIETITQHFENIASGKTEADPSDEKILNDFLLHPELFKSFIIDPHNKLFPENLRTTIQEILNNPGYKKQFEQLKTAVLNAKNQYIMNKKESKIQLELQAKQAKALQKLDQQSKTQLQELQQLEHKSNEQSQRTTITQTESTEHEQLIQKFKDIIKQTQKKEMELKEQAIKQKQSYNLQKEQEKISNLIKESQAKEFDRIHETEQQYRPYMPRQKILESKDTERPSAEPTPTKPSQKILKSKDTEQPSAEPIPTKPIFTQLTESEAMEKLQQNRNRRAKFANQTEDEFNHARINKLKKDIEKANYANADQFANIDPSKFIQNSTDHQNIINQYVEEFCQPFKEALESKILPSDQSAHKFLNKIPLLALQNGVSFRLYLNLNHMEFFEKDIESALFTNDITLHEKNIIFDRIAEKIKKYKEDLNSITPAQYRASHLLYKESLSSRA